MFYNFYDYYFLITLKHCSISYNVRSRLSSVRTSPTTRSAMCSIKTARYDVIRMRG